jgi:hypothetical protein
MTKMRGIWRLTGEIAATPSTRVRCSRDSITPVVAAIVLMCGAALAEGIPARRGAFAFHYGTPLTEEGLAWYSRFDVLVTHDPLPRAQVERLHAAGTRLLLYEWSVAFYETRATGWQRSLLKSRRQNLLNDQPLNGGAGDATAPAWYFDPASPAHQTNRATDLVRRIKASGYDGVFFDTTTIASVHPDARREYERRHPRLPYDVAFSRFLIRLRMKLPKGVIFTNQGYRSAENYLPYVDADLTESLITWPRGNAYEVRPWNDPADPWNSIDFLMRTVIEPMTVRYPKVRFLHLNYMTDPSDGTIPLVVAVAKLFDGEGFVAAEPIAMEIDPIYFRDFGKPMGARVDLANGDAAYRVFEHGMIAVSASKEAITIDDMHITLPATAGKARVFFFDNK